MTDILNDKSLSPIRVLVADDHRIIREGLRQIFGLIDDIEVVAEASDGKTLWLALAAGGIDLVLLDLLMPGASGEKLLTDLHLRYPVLPILVLSMHSEPQVAQRVIKAGAAGYLTKDCDAETLLSAVRKVASGGNFLDSRLAEAVVFTGALAGQMPEQVILSVRELEILRFLTNGVGITRIATQLGISNKTVSTHKARLLRKLGLTSVAELVKYAIANHLGDWA
jgi:DNA-binding NarL/FixJ family response regulator